MPRRLEHRAQSQGLQEPRQPEGAQAFSSEARLFGWKYVARQLDHRRWKSPQHTTKVALKLSRRRNG